MSFIGKIVIIMLCCILSACAIHPLPENATGVKTSDIVHRNRCEAADALFRAEQWLLYKNKLAAAQALTKIGIVLSYQLDMTESDGVTANFSLEQLLPKTTTTFNPNASDMLKRENTRDFTVADNYKTLMTMRNCDKVPVGPNYQYPIVGTIGIDETIRSFLTMAFHEDLSTYDKDLPTNPSTSIAGAPTMVETLVFTTTVTAGVTPTIMLTPIAGPALRLTNASLAVALSRIDAHQVVVALGLPTVVTPEGDSHKYVPYSILSSGRVASRNRTPLLIDASVPAGTNASSGISVALEAANNNIIRHEVLRATSVLY
jgi:hypothetical protein